MNKRKTLLWSIVGVVAVILVTVGLTYAYWLVTRTQQGENVVSTACLDIALLNEEDDIDLSNQYPISDVEGKELKPFKFTVTNNCKTSLDYQIALETISDAESTMAATSIKAVLNDNTPKLLDRYEDTNTTVSGAYEAHVLELATLAPSGSEGSSKNYELRLWIDKDAPVSEINKTFVSKITVSTGQHITTKTDQEILAEMGLEIGDYVDYTYDTAENYTLSKEYSGFANDQIIAQMDPADEYYEWRVIGVDDAGNVELAYVFATDKGNVSSGWSFDQHLPQPTSSVAGEPTTMIQLGGAVGYNNGVYLLHDIASKLYSNKELGITARSLNVDDLEDRLTDAGKQAIYDAGKYHKEYTYEPVLPFDGVEGDTKYNAYPSLYVEEQYSGVDGTIRSDGVTPSDPYYTSLSELTTANNAFGRTTDSIKIQHNYWGEPDTQTLESHYDSKEFYDMIFPRGNPNSGYWLATRFTRATGTWVSWGYVVVVRQPYGSYNSVDSVSKYFTDGEDKSSGLPMYLRPVVTIPSDIKIVTNENENSSSNMWTLEK